MMRALVVLTILIAVVSGKSQKPGKKITNLPGYSGKPLDMESGYIHVGGARHLFYWMVRAQNKDPNAPLVFWYTGGPGCSGLSALMTENGPLSPNAQGGLDYRSVSWTNIANVVFLEQPAFVGFSYSNDPLDHVTDDNKSSKDNYAFVQGFLEAYPEFVGRKTWLTGESYAGEYVPHLTLRILQDKSTQIYKQLEGIMVGNPVMGGDWSDNFETFQMLNGHGLVSQTLVTQWEAAGCNSRGAAGGSTCDGIVSAAQDQVGVIDQELRRRGNAANQPSLDPDDLYQDFCTGNGTLEYVATIASGCHASGDLTTDYLNRKDVKEAIHASGEFGAGLVHWSICSSRIVYTPSNTDQITRYQQFPTLKPGIKMLVYSGDIDILTVPFGYTAPAVFELTKNSPTIRKWGPWFTNGQSVGYYEQFQLNAQTRFTYATVRGAGHEVPAYQPWSAYHMFSRFMKNGNLTDPDPTYITRANRQRQGDFLRRILKRTGLRR